MLILFAISVPMAVITFLIAADFRADLSGLIPRQGATLKGRPILSWEMLEDNDDHRSTARARLDEGEYVTMLGYMMDGSEARPEGTSVATFVLLPDAGTWIHPAHRDSEEMVEVRLAKQDRIPFTRRRLIWVTGWFVRLRIAMRYGEASYGLLDARVMNASKEQIHEYFQP